VAFITASGGWCEYLKLATGDQRPATGETLPSKTVATAIVRHVQVPCKVPRKAKRTGLKTGHYKTGHYKTGQELRCQEWRCQTVLAREPSRGVKKTTQVAT